MRAAAVEAGCRSGGRHRRVWKYGFLSPHSTTRMHEVDVPAFQRQGSCGVVLIGG
jgi:hypothetical protein